ncbi:MAG: PLP-dependent aminotransferase family protein [Acidimicrobiia bacterium]
MAVQWTGSGPDVLLHLDRSDAAPLGAQLQRELRDAIQRGRVAVGERLPSSRQLARELGVSRGLVVDSYSQLGSEGFLATRAGSGTTVAIGAIVLPARQRPRLSPASVQIDFSYGEPDLHRFPMKDWLWSLDAASRTVPVASLGYSDPRGVAEARTVLASYVRRVRGSLADPESIVVTAGYSQGLNLVLQVLARRGARHIAVEDPGDDRNVASVRRAGMEPVPIPVDGHGLDVGALAASPASAVVVTPAHQCPTGVALAPERRHLLVHWATRSGGVIIEDDYDAEFRYDRQPVGSLHGLAPAHVVALGTVSKSLAPFLRLGWMLCPPDLVDALAAEKEACDRAAPALDQVALAELMRSGRYDRHIRRMRAVYTSRRQQLIDSLRTHAPDIVVSGLEAGLHAVAHLPNDVAEADVIAAARDRSVAVYGMSSYRFDRNDRPPALVLGFGNLTEANIERGVAELAAGIEEVLGEPIRRRA